MGLALLRKDTNFLNFDFNFKYSNNIQVTVSNITEIVYWFTFSQRYGSYWSGIFKQLFVYDDF